MVSIRILDLQKVGQAHELQRRRVRRCFFMAYKRVKNGGFISDDFYANWPANVSCQHEYLRNGLSGCSEHFTADVRLSTLPYMITPFQLRWNGVRTYNKMWTDILAFAIALRN